MLKGIENYNSLFLGYLVSLRYGDLIELNNTASRVSLVKLVRMRYFEAQNWIADYKGTVGCVFLELDSYRQSHSV